MTRACKADQGAVQSLAERRSPASPRQVAELIFRSWAGRTASCNAGSLLTMEWETHQLHHLAHGYPRGGGLTIG